MQQCKLLLETIYEFKVNLYTVSAKMMLQSMSLNSYIGFDPADAHARLLQHAEPQTGILIDLSGEETNIQQQSQDGARPSHDIVIANQNLLDLESGDEHRQPSPEENSFPQESQELF